MSKQLKISDLKRVVNVDEITKLASILRDKNSSETKILNAIEQLSTKMPSKEVLFQTKLGFILKDVSKNDNLAESTRLKALNLRKKWKEFHKNLLLAQKLDVKCDKPTTEKRNSSKIQLIKSIREALNHENCDTGNINAQISDLEFLIFQYCDNLCNWKYTNLVKNCVYLFKSDYLLIDSYMNGSISTKDVLTRAIQYRGSKCEPDSTVD